MSPASFTKTAISAKKNAEQIMKNIPFVVFERGFISLIILQFLPGDNDKSYA